MKIKDDRIQGEIFVTGVDLFAAVKNLDDGIIYPDEDKATYVAEQAWQEKVYRVEVTLYEA